MLRFISINAPARYLFVDPDTGRTFTERSKEKLIAHIVNYRAQNGLEPLHNLGDVIDDYLCRLPENIGKCEEYKPVLRRGWLAYFTGAMHVLKNVAYGDGNMVEQETADKRAAVCKTCPLNVFPDKGPFIQWTDEVALAATGGRKTTSDKHLGNCDACTCVLKSLVWAKDVKPTTVEKLTLPKHCWKLW